MPEIYPIPGFNDPVSSLSHFLGAGVFAVLSFLLLRRGWGNRLRVACLGVFAFACVLQLSLSGVYHQLEPGGAGRAVLLRLDHSAIFILIAGTFTPIHGILFRGFGRWGTLALVWAAAATGITLKMIYFNDIPDWLSVAVFLGLGWKGVITGLALWARFGFEMLRPLYWGAVFFTSGALVEYHHTLVFVPGVIGPHEFLHVAVLTGMGFHWWFIYRFADGEVPQAAEVIPTHPYLVSVHVLSPVLEGAPQVTGWDEEVGASCSAGVPSLRGRG